MLSVITDQKLPVEVDSLIVSYSAVVVTATDYSPFGVGLYGRSWSGEYRYGFNGKENDPENFTGAYDFGARIMDVRLGRWLSVDNRFSQFVSNSAYCYAVNTPLYFIDPDGNKISGATEEDIILVQLAIITVLSEHTAMAHLFQISEDGLSLQPIDPETFFSEIKKLGPENADARNVANALYHAIGSDIEYEISFVEDAEDISGLTNDNEYQSGKDLEKRSGGRGFAQGPNKMNILLNEQAMKRKNKDYGDPSTEGGLNVTMAGLVQLDMDLSTVAALMGAMISANDPYVSAGNHDQQIQTKLNFSVTMIKIENTIARAMDTWQTSGQNRFGGVAEKEYSKLEGAEKRVKEFEYGWSANPRDLNITPNPVDYHQKPSDAPRD